MGRFVDAIPLDEEEPQTNPDETTWILTEFTDLSAGVSEYQELSLHDLDAGSDFVITVKVKNASDCGLPTEEKFKTSQKRFSMFRFLKFTSVASVSHFCTALSKFKSLLKADDK